MVSIGCWHSERATCRSVFGASLKCSLSIYVYMYLYVHVCTCTGGLAGPFCELPEYLPKELVCLPDFKAILP